MDGMCRSASMIVDVLILSSVLILKVMISYKDFNWYSFSLLICSFRFDSLSFISFISFISVAWGFHFSSFISRSLHLVTTVRLLSVAWGAQQVCIAPGQAQFVNRRIGFRSLGAEFLLGACAESSPSPGNRSVQNLVPPGLICWEQYGSS